MKEIVIGLVSVSILGSGLGSHQEEITYHQTIAPLIQEKCLPCHSKGTGYAPFDLSTYDGVKSRIELIRTQVLAKNMPPIWSHSAFGEFSYLKQFSDQEAVQLQKWIQQKMPLGKKADLGITKQLKSDFSNPLAFDFAKGSSVKAEGLPYWSVLSMELNPKGGSFESFSIDPSNPRVIRYATLAIVPKDMKLPTTTNGSMDLDAKYLVGVWAPGYWSWNLPKGLSYQYGPNSKLVVQAHYRPAGKPENAAFRVSLSQSKRPTTKSPVWISMQDKDVFIPSGKSRVIEISRPVDRDLSLISILPEARFYAGQIQLFYTSKEGKTMTVFDVVRWDPYWGGNYMFPKPVVLEKGGTLKALFHYNNDRYCRINEGKNLKDIHAGPTASDEVCRMHLLVGP